MWVNVLSIVNIYLVVYSKSIVALEFATFSGRTTDLLCFMDDDRSIFMFDPNQMIRW